MFLELGDEECRGLGVAEAGAAEPVFEVVVVRVLEPPPLWVMTEIIVEGCALVVLLDDAA